MRRRRTGDRNLTAEEVIAVGDRALHDHVQASTEVRNHAHRQALAEYGYTPLDYFRARYWIRRGKPEGYPWHE